MRCVHTHDSHVCGFAFLVSLHDIIYAPRAKYCVHPDVAYMRVWFRFFSWHCAHDHVHHARRVVHKHMLHMLLWLYFVVCRCMVYVHTTHYVLC